MRTEEEMRREPRVGDVWRRCRDGVHELVTVDHVGQEPGSLIGMVGDKTPWAIYKDGLHLHFDTRHGGVPIPFKIGEWYTANGFQHAEERRCTGIVLVGDKWQAQLSEDRCNRGDGSVRDGGYVVVEGQGHVWKHIDTNNNYGRPTNRVDALVAGLAYAKVLDPIRVERPASASSIEAFVHYAAATVGVRGVSVEKVTYTAHIGCLHVTCAAGSSQAELSQLAKSIRDHFPSCSTVFVDRVEATQPAPDPRPRAGQTWRDSKGAFTILDIEEMRDAHPLLCLVRTDERAMLKRTLEGCEYVEGPTEPETEREEFERVWKLASEDVPPGVDPESYRACLVSWVGDSPHERDRVGSLRRAWRHSVEGHMRYIPIGHVSELRKEPVPFGRGDALPTRRQGLLERPTQPWWSRG